MITLERFLEIEAAVRETGYPDAIERSEAPTAPVTAYDFAAGAISVIANSGMRNSVARPIYERYMVALEATDSCKSVFGHPASPPAST